MTSVPSPSEGTRSPEPRPALASLAARLRAARETQGASLADVAEATRVPMRYLRSLESDAPIEAYPSLAYARFFFREYAGYLRIHDDELEGIFQQRYGGSEPSLREARALIPPATRARGAWLITFVSVVALVAIAVGSFGLRRRDDTAPAVVRAPSPAAPAPGKEAEKEPSPKPSTAPSPAQVRSVAAVLVLSGPSWIRATVDGEVLMAETLAAGRRERFKAKRTLELRLGSAGAVELHVNGERVVTGAPGEVVDLTFTVRNGRLVKTRA